MSAVALSPALAWPPRRIMLWGLLWALLLSAAEFLVIAPLHTLPTLGFLIWWLTTWSLPVWYLTGSAYLLVACRAERRNDWTAFVAGGLAVAVACTALQTTIALLMNELWRGSMGVGIIIRRVGFAGQDNLRLRLESLLVYDLWINLFYGGLLMTAFVLMARSERMQAMLRDAAIARGRSEAMHGELQLQALQAQVDPRLLLACLDQAQALYRDQPDRADALLEHLVDFLRTAMPGLKQRHSTLAAELQLAEAFAALQQAMPGRARWSIEAPRGPLDIGFPSLLLLPLLALAPETATPRLVVQQAAGTVTLQLLALGRAVPADLEHRTRSSLRALLGTRFRMRADATPPYRLEIELDVPCAPRENDDAPRTS